MDLMVGNPPDGIVSDPESSPHFNPDPEPQRIGILWGATFFWKLPS